MRGYTLKIKTGEALDLSVVGDYARIRSSAVDIRLEAPDSGEWVELQPGDAAHLSPFSRLRLSHAAASDQDVVLQVGRGTRTDMHFPVRRGAFDQTVVNVTDAGQQVVAGNNVRRYLLLQNRGPHAVYLSMDGGADAAADSIEIISGASYELESYVPTNAVTARCAAGQTAKLVVVEG